MKTCLIVDDSRVIRMVARKILEELRFTVDEAADGKEALAACGRGMPDAVLLDWYMPVMDGIEFLTALRGMAGGEAPVVVFCTSETAVDSIKQALDSGADEYIMKPFDTAIIQSKFAQVGLI